MLSTYLLAAVTRFLAAACAFDLLPFDLAKVPSENCQTQETNQFFENNLLRVTLVEYFVHRAVSGD